jgi:hypothetical protein
MMRLLKYDGIAVACAAIALLSSLMLFLCSTWLLMMGTPLARSIALGVLSMCGSGFIACMEISRTSSAARSRARKEAVESIVDR